MSVCVLVSLPPQAFVAKKGKDRRMARTNQTPKSSGAFSKLFEKY